MDAKERGRVGDIDRPTKTVPGKVGDGAAAGRRQLHRGRQEGRRSSSATSRSRSASGSASISAGTAGPLLDRSGARDERPARLRDDAARRRHAHRGPASRRARQLDRDRDERAGRRSRARGSTSTLTYDGSSRAAGIGLFVDGVRPPTARRHRSPAPQHRPRRHEEELGRRRPPIRIGRRGDERLDGVTVDELRVFDRQLSRFEVQALGRRRRSARRRAADPAPRRDRRRSRPRCASTICCASIRRRAAARRTLTGVRGEENALLTSLVEVMAMRERADAAPDVHPGARRLRRADRAGRAGTPAALGAFPEGPAGQPPRAGALAARRQRIR